MKGISRRISGKFLQLIPRLRWDGKSEEFWLIAVFASLGMLFGSLYWLYTQTPAAMFAVENLPLLAGKRDPGTAKLTLLGDTFSGYVVLRNPDFARALAAVGLEFTYKNELDQVVRVTQLNAGEANLMVTTLDQYLQQQPDGKIVGLVSRSVGAHALVLNNQAYPDIDSLDALQRFIADSDELEYGLEIAFASDSASEYMMATLETQFPDLKLSKLKPYRLADASDVWQQLQDPTRSPLVAMLWEPYVTRAANQGYEVAIASQDMPNSIVSVIVASDRLLESNPEAVSAFLEVYYRQIDDDVRDATELAALMAKDSNLPEDEGSKVLNQLDFFTALEAQTWLRGDQLTEQIQTTAALLAINEKLNEVPRDLSLLMDTEAINIAAQNTQTLLDLVKGENPDLAARFQGEGQTLQTDD